MKDPYSVLGINKSATDEEVKAAYRELARKYHPDNYAENPLSDLASEKMKEINDAYDQIMNSRRRGGSNRSSGSSSYSNADSSFPDIRQFIASGRFEEAQELLDGVPNEKRNAEWYFLNGSVLYRRGWFEGAYSAFATACRLDPQNAEYREAFSRIQRQTGGGYHNPYGSPSNMGGSCTGCDVCQGLICADCCCECMGGDLIRCC